MRLTNPDINANLTDLRNDLRSGEVTIYTRADSNNLRDVVGDYIYGLTGGPRFTKETMNPQTVRRFEAFFVVPEGPKSQDQIAWAIQNFINRRSNPWSHIKQPEAEQQSQFETQSV